MMSDDDQMKERAADREAGWFPYMRLGPGAQHKIESLQEAFEKKPPDYCYFYVCVAFTDVLDERYADPFTIRVKKDIMVEDLRREILSKSKDMSKIASLERHGDKLRMVLGHRALVDGTRLSEYDPSTFGQVKRKYPSPYRGTIFITNGLISPLPPKPGHRYR